MGDTWPPMNSGWSHAADLERLRRRRPSLHQRIARRARELGLIERQRCLNAMIAELYLGRLADQDIETWQPPVRGTLQVLEQIHAKLTARRKD